ncbi:Holo-[acyl-carrier-protein] synthase [Corynebacterium capitovis DSM 44611]|uniref:holo-ACP synthase AcpS n=1 Tax=Corynebacterium capitovis TaxID=131081 RepID=UPI00035ED139|nr:holo-ACP synthase [Corynebacterium capitovis]WKD57011.1 Holo-[acyl-carrier-protein] synthase [Corynebacterium capitovis DSM 44611]
MLAIGTDIVHVPSFAAQLDVPGSRFRAVFTDRELRTCAFKPDRAASLAARWAAKEAYIKAWSQSLYGSPPLIAPDAVDFAQIEVVADAFGRVAVVLRGEIARLGPPAESLSLSHDGEVAIAVCVVDAGGRREAICSST